LAERGDDGCFVVDAFVKEGLEGVWFFGEDEREPVADEVVGDDVFKFGGGDVFGDWFFGEME